MKTINLIDQILCKWREIRLPSKAVIFLFVFIVFVWFGRKVPVLKTEIINLFPENWLDFFFAVFKIITIGDVFFVLVMILLIIIWLKLSTKKMDLKTVRIEDNEVNLRRSLCIKRID